MLTGGFGASGSGGGSSVARLCEAGYVSSPLGASSCSCGKWGTTMYPAGVVLRTADVRKLSTVREVKYPVSSQGLGVTLCQQLLRCWSVIGHEVMRLTQL